MWLKIPYSGLGWMGDFGELVALETPAHPWVWWLLGLGSGLRDYMLLHLWFLAICDGRRVLAVLLLYVVIVIVIIVIIVTIVTIVTIVIIVTKTVVE